MKTFITVILTLWVWIYMEPIIVPLIWTIRDLVQGKKGARKELRMIEQYKVNDLRDALQNLIRDNVRWCDDAGEIVIKLEDSEIRQLIDNIDYLVGKEPKL